MTIWSLLLPLEIFYGHLVYFMVIWYIFPRFVFCTKKNLATLVIIFNELCGTRSIADRFLPAYRKLQNFDGGLLAKKRYDYRQTLPLDDDLHLVKHFGLFYYFVVVTVVAAVFVVAVFVEVVTAVVIVVVVAAVFVFVDDVVVAAVFVDAVVVVAYNFQIDCPITRMFAW
jgi:hypothetical protein